jgi:3-hydroxyisobutyrate dehydrogenase
MKLAFIGLGAMGYPIAGHLAQRFPTLVYNRTASKALEHAKTHGSKAANLEEVASADTIFTCLPTSVEVDHIATQLLPHLKASLWIDHTSGEPGLARQTAQRLAEKGVTYLDACLSGGVGGAVAAKSTVMVGGDPEAFAQIVPLLEAFAARIVHVGPIGAAHAVKAINQGLLAVNLWSLSEGLTALAKQGVDLKAALEAINASSGRSNASENLFPQRVLNRSFPNTFALELLTKDLGICKDILQESQIPAVILPQLHALFSIAQRTKKGLDHTAIAQILEEWSGVEIR